MLGFRKAKKADVLSHWYTLVEHFNVSSKEFYAAVEQELENRKVPGLAMSRVFFAESGFMSANRLYLRMKRERLVFDICAAPFGTSYFFSMRFAELPKSWPWGTIFASLLTILTIVRCCMVLLHIVAWLLIGFVVLTGLILTILLVWIVSSFTKDSYYRQDTRLMYLELVNAVVKQKVAETTSAGGFHLLKIRQYCPLMDDLYRTTQVSIAAVEAPAEAQPEPVTA
jgi:hypothetical protein